MSTRPTFARVLCLLLASLAACAKAEDDVGTTGAPGAGGSGGGEVGFGGAPIGCAGAAEDDDDGDGYSEDDGDCNDCDPIVNPGAVDVADSGIDEDCSGAVDEPEAGCDGSIAMDSLEAMDFARAMGLCRTTTVDATPARWGVLEGGLTQVDGESPTDPIFHGVLDRFGPGNLAREGRQLVVLSSGTARSEIDAGGVDPNGYGYRNLSMTSPYPEGFPKNAAGCPDPTTATANDSVRLRLSIRVPTNAQAFGFDLAFLTTEWPEFVCSEYNDAFVALLKSGVAGPADQHDNISFDGAGNPINVNTAFFTVLAGPQLDGDWMSDGRGGGTGWLHSKAPVEPGEVIEIAFAVWDTGDHSYDSFVLLDNWRWYADAAEAPTTEPVK